MIGIGTDFANLSGERSYSLSYYTKGRTYTPLRACALCRGLISAQGAFPARRYGGFAATRGCTPYKVLLKEQVAIYLLFPVMWLS